MEKWKPKAGFPLSHTARDDDRCFHPNPKQKIALASLGQISQLHYPKVGQFRWPKWARARGQTQSIGVWPDAGSRRRRLHLRANGRQLGESSILIPPMKCHLRNALVADWAAYIPRLDSIFESMPDSYPQWHQLFTFGTAWYKIRTATEIFPSNLLKQKVWLPGMGSNHELYRILNSHNLLILQSH